MNIIARSLSIFIHAIIALAIPNLGLTQQLDDSRLMVSTIQNIDTIEKANRDIATMVQNMEHLSEAERIQLIEAIRIDSRIVGGVPTSIDENPWQVALIRGLVSEPNRSQFCGGSIISTEWVITAAHCVDNFIVSQLANRINIVAGTTNYESGGQRVSVKRIFIHPAWNSANMDNDLALLQLGEILSVGKSISIIPKETDLNSQTKLNITGWGALYEGGPGSKDLIGVSVPYVDNQVCNQPDSYNGVITSNMFCAGKREGGLDSCQGDSGGPIWTNLNGKEVLAGVVSWGDGCARKLKYGIYTRLANYYDWITTTMASASILVSTTTFDTNGKY